MDRRTRVFLTALIALLGALLALGLAVFPFQYGLVESLLVAGGLVGVGVVEFVLDQPRFGG